MKKILYFTAAWCGPCKTLGPIMQSLSGQINYEKVDVDSSNDLSIQYGVRNVPSLILVDETGEVKGRLVGVQSKDEILNFYNG
jgi:thioredoxin 1|tara:strand:+ start:1935 stop:2183 length:249 start_codon:yes stop_codon:yes gene_type:complete